MSFFLVSLLTTLTLSLQDKVFLERPDKQPTKLWKELGRTALDKELKIILAVKQENIELLLNKLDDVSNPLSNNYGNYMTTDEVQNLVKPSLKTLNTIKHWLKKEINIKNNDIIYEKNNGDVLSFKTNVAKLEKLLNTTYYDYININTNKIVSRIKIGENYYISKKVVNCLDFIEPTHRFPIYHTIKKTNKMGLKAGQVTPQLLRELYKTGSVEGKMKNNSVGVSSFQDQYYSKSDLNTFWKDYDTVSTVVTNVPSTQPQGHGIEVELDTQYMSAMAQKVPMQAWYSGNRNFPDALMEWSTNVLNSKNPPLLFSVSYGTTETYYGRSFVTRYNQELAQMGTAGITVFFAAGDSGAGGGCATPPFEPDYPASSPYVTAVGGVTGGSPNRSPPGETVWVDGGGGFSNYAAQPSYQKTAVEAFLKNCKSTLPPSGDYNASGRAYPDISAQSVDFVIIVEGRKEGVSGTSCASPTAGGVFGLINDKRLQNGQKQLGFLNPLLYQTYSSNSAAFNDCTEGYNKGCRAAKGFTACKGFDTASGLGSPNYQKLTVSALKYGEKTKKWVKKQYK